jgi:hypothetical protein
MAAELFSGFFWRAQAPIVLLQGGSSVIMADPAGPCPPAPALRDRGSVRPGRANRLPDAELAGSCCLSRLLRD